MKVLLSELWGHLSHKRKLHFYLLLFLMLASSIAEAFSIGTIIPFLGVLTTPEIFMGGQFFQLINGSLEIYNIKDLQLYLTLFFSASIFLAASIRTILLYVTINVSFQTGADLSNQVYKNILQNSYEGHKSRNSSDLVNLISTQINEVIHYVLLPAITLVSATVIVVILIITLLFVLPLSVIFALSFFGILYSLILKISRKRLEENSRLSVIKSIQCLKVLQESFGGIREVILGNLQQYFCSLFYKNDRELRRAQSSTQFLSQFPRFGIEAAGMLMLVALAYFLSNTEGAVSAIPMLAALAIGAQKMLPALQQIYLSRSTMEGAQAPLRNVLSNLRGFQNSSSTVIKRTALRKDFFRGGIELRDVSFGYTGTSSLILKNINLTIRRGERLGVIGETGGGKSTLIDLIMGLLRPTSGMVLIDDCVLDEANLCEWQSCISHVPQVIFLSDATIAQNIAFGVEMSNIDMIKVEKCATIACISDFIESQPLSYETLVGEGGCFLSGGQRQRIGIARALYKATNVLILDEATSALDPDTERAVIQSLEGIDPNITVIMIAHKQSTLKNCQKICKVQDGIIHLIENA